MKKIVFLILSSFIFAGSSFAAGQAGVDLSTVLENTALSNSVEGFYSSDTNGTAYILQTGHSAGNRAFGSGSFATTISYSEVADPTAILITAGTGFDSSEFDSGAVWTPVGE